MNPVLHQGINGVRGDKGDPGLPGPQGPSVSWNNHDFQDTVEACVAVVDVGPTSSTDTCR